jgi:hypothetical protein
MVTFVSQLRIVGVEAGPRFTVEGVDPVTGSAVSFTVYIGHVALARNTDFRGIVSATSMEPVSFFVPESAPLVAPPARTWLETSLRAIRSMGNPNLVFFGAIGARADAAPDPRGGGQHWLQVSFQIPAASVESVEINYRVTVVA